MHSYTHMQTGIEFHLNVYKEALVKKNSSTVLEITSNFTLGIQNHPPYFSNPNLL